MIPDYIKEGVEKYGEEYLSKALGWRVEFTAKDLLVRQLELKVLLKAAQKYKNFPEAHEHFTTRAGFTFDDVKRSYENYCEARDDYHSNKKSA